MNQLNYRRSANSSSTMRIVIAFLFAVLFLGYPTQPSSIFAQSAQPIRTITVVGEGKVTLQPDIARAEAW